VSTSLDDSIVLITSGDTRKQGVTGTGFVIHQDGLRTYVLTCSHVVRDVGGSENVMADGLAAEIIAQGDEQDFDLTVLQVEGLSDRPTLKLSQFCQEGQFFVVIGFYLYGRNNPRMKQITGVIGQQSEIRSLKLRSSVDAWELGLDEENYLRPGYSGAPVIEQLSNRVMAVVTHQEGQSDRSEKGAAVSINALREVWVDMPSELLLDEPETAHLESEPSFNARGEEEFSATYVWKIIWIAFVLFIICIISLAFSYHFSSSRAWQDRFNLPWADGLIIEAARSIIYLACTSYLISVVFQTESLEVLGLSRTLSNYSRIVYLIRIFIIAVTILNVTVLVDYHLHSGPEGLANDPENTLKDEVTLKDTKGFEVYKLPYLCYLPYSFVNFIIVAGLTISVSLYAAVKDLVSLNDCRRALKRELKKFVEQSPNSRRNQKYCKEIEREFKRFCEDFIDKIGRYTNLFLCLAIVVSFEHSIGKHNLMPEAQALTGLGYLIFASVFLLILFGFLHYDNAFREAARSLFDIRCDDLDLFESQNGFIDFLKRVFRNYFGLYVGILVITLALVFSGISPIIGNALQGLTR
jgi:hypothetical protein